MWEFKQYQPLIKKILDEGEKRNTRAGPAYSIFGEMLDIDVSKEFPLLRGRKMFYKPVLGELAAFLKGPKHIEDFKKYGCNYWDAWGKPVFPRIAEEGNLTLDYGNKWLDFHGVNQLEQLIKGLKEDPIGRRHIVTGWDPSNIPNLSLPCCHLLYQWYVRDGKYLDMIWYQRSVDVMVGLPSDIILAAAWNMIIANQVGLQTGRIKFILADTHIYANHIEPTLDYLRQLRDFKQKIEPDSYGVFTNIKASINPRARLDNFTLESLIIEKYRPQPAIKFKLNV